MSLTTTRTISEIDNVFVKRNQLKKKQENIENVLGSQYVQDTELLRINRKMKSIQNQMLTCLRRINDGLFGHYQNSRCTGEKLQLLQLDADYLKRVITARTAARVRSMLFEFCYKKAALNPKQSIACDQVQIDSIEMLWNGLNFHKTLKKNKRKYLLDIVEMDEKVFELIMELMKEIQENHEMLMNEIQVRKSFVTLKVNQYINRRQKMIQSRSEKLSKAPQPLSFSHHIELREQLNEGGQTIPELHTKKKQSLHDVYFPKPKIQGVDQFLSELTEKKLKKEKQLELQEQYYKQLITVDGILEENEQQILEKMKEKFGKDFIPSKK